MHALFCSVALEAVGDRSVQTPTSKRLPSATQHAYQAEEDRLIGIPPQQAIDQLATSTENLARQTHKGIHERLELQPQHPTLLRLMLWVPTARPLGQVQGPPGFKVPG